MRSKREKKIKTVKYCLHTIKCLIYIQKLTLVTMHFMQLLQLLVLGKDNPTETMYNYGQKGISTHGLNEKFINNILPAFSS